MAAHETNNRKIVRRLLRDGWTNLGGGKHDKYAHPAHPETIIVVPRHPKVSDGVARDIAKKAGWK